MKKLYRSQTNKKIAGLCGGLGEYFEIDPTFIRLVLLFVCFFTAVFPVLIVYFIAAIIVPLEPTNKLIKDLPRLFRSKKNRMLAGVCGGMSYIFKIDVTIIRLLFVFLMIITAILPMLITYIVAWIIIPENPDL
jgi:phage shock protein PspC (stress-responsive transcriptional regulator)